MARLATIACLVALRLAATAARADDCHPAYDQALERAMATGKAAIVKEVEQLPHVALTGYRGNESCEVVLPGDVKADSDLYATSRVEAIWLNQLDRNEAALAVALNPSERDAFESQIRKIDFAGVHIGETMQDVFEALRRQHYVSAAAGHQIYKGLYRYDIECGDDKLRYGDGGYPSPPLKAKICGVDSLFSGPGPFTKTDENGTHYEIEVNFTAMDSISRADALKNAKVWRLKASVSMKNAVGLAHYEKLAEDRYGSVLEGRMPERLRGQLTYAGYHDNWDEDTLFKIEPGPDRLAILAQDQWFHDCAYEDAVEQSLALQHQAAQSAPRPKF